MLQGGGGVPDREGTSDAGTASRRQRRLREEENTQRTHTQSVRQTLALSLLCDINELGMRRITPFNSRHKSQSLRTCKISCSFHWIFSAQSKRPIVKTSHSQNVPYSKRPQSKRPLFEAKRPRRSKRPKSKRTDVNELM